MSVWVFTCGSEKSHVPPASQAKPFSHFVTASALAGRRTSVIVFRSICSGGRKSQVYAKSRKRCKEIYFGAGLADPDRARSCRLQKRRRYIGRVLTTSYRPQRSLP